MSEDRLRKAVNMRAAKFQVKDQYNMVKIGELEYIVRITPIDGIYKGRTYYLNMTFPARSDGVQFPFTPPKIKFISAIQHMYVN